MLLSYEHRMHLYLWRRVNRANKETGKAPISLRIEIDGFDRAEFATGEWVLESHWNQARKCLEPPRGLSKPEQELLKQANARLTQLQVLADRAYMLLRSQGHSPSPATIREMLRGKPQQVRRLTDAVDLLEQVKRQKGMQDKTLKTVQSLRAALLPYLQHKHTQALPLVSVGVEWLRGWERWLLREGYAVSSIRLYISTLLQALREAAHEGWLPLASVPDYRYASGAYEPEKRHLSYAEVLALHAALASFPRSLHKPAVMFLVSCYTGLSYVDYCRVASDPPTFFVEVVHPITGRPVRGVRLVRQKTQRKTVETWTPLLPQATAFLDSLVGPLPILSPTTVNEYLKTIAARLQLSLLDLKFKDARSTFAQWTRDKLGIGPSSELARHSEKMASKHYSDRTSEELLRKMHVLGAELSYN